ncbi:MAG: hypothetical protein ACI4HZ_08725 [Ruminococcus sp.]
MSILFVTMSLFGCDKNPAKPDRELTSVSISQNHMDRTFCYNFWVRKEKDSYLFDAECILADYDNNEYSEVNFTDKEISQEEFEEFTRIDEKYNFISLKRPKKEKKFKFFALDETTTYFTVKYGEDTFSLYPNGDCYSEVSENFFALAEKYNKTIN